VLRTYPWLPSVRAFGAVAFLFAPFGAVTFLLAPLALSPFCSRLWRCRLSVRAFGAVAFLFTPFALSN
jgi:hypothetical protein